MGMLRLKLFPRALALSGLLLLNNGAEASSDSCIDVGNRRDADTLTTELLAWLRQNGAYINGKLSVGRVVPDDSSSPRGVFARDAMEEGETVCRIPWHLVLGPKDAPSDNRLQSDCGAIDMVREAIDGEDITPYTRYLRAQPMGQTAGFWSPAARDLLVDMLDTEKTQHITEYDDLPPHGIEDFDEDELKCNADVNDSLYRHAAMLVKMRSDYEFMVPFYDMMNHHNGKANVKHLYNPYKPDQNIDQVGYDIVTTKAIKPGEQLFNSYNQCSICSARYDWFGTPEMFLHYGFVEPLPQRWLIDFARIKFDLDWRDGDESTGEVVVNFLVPPSEKGISLLRTELTRLKSFSSEHRGMDYEDAGISANEWESLWQYYDALYNALSHAVESNAPLTDEVWSLSDDWWVQDGTLVAADTDEHYVLPIINMG